MKPPYIIFFTPSGRFEIKEKICLSFTNYHPEFWQPAWTIQNILVALVSFFPVNEDNLAIGALRATKHERQFLAKESPSWKCETCGKTNGELAADFMTEVTEGAVKNLQAENVLGKELTQGGF
jgi:ubiquitin-conjugating enzyme E2 J1